SGRGRRPRRVLVLGASRRDYWASARHRRRRDSLISPHHLMSTPLPARTIFRQLFDASSGTYTYLLADADTREALLIDPVHEQFERDRQLLSELELHLVHTLETHVHADHVTSASRFRDALRSRSVVAAVGGAACGDLRVNDGDEIQLGNLRLQ